MKRSAGSGVIAGLGGRIAGVAGFVLLGNAGAWAWALAAFRDHPALIGTAMLAYSFGLRHAFDADHIAAIDNVTRKLMQEGQRPVGVGLYFSLGHSSVVIALSAILALGAFALQDRFETLKNVGAVVGAGVSSLFLFGVAAANLSAFFGLRRAFREMKAGRKPLDEDIDLALANRGLLGRVFRRAFLTVDVSWRMYPIGVLFGLGFDTATEIGVLGISATQATQGLSVWSILVFPALFTAGMTLLDTADSILMLGAYGWAFIEPMRKLHYNLTITAASTVAAFAVGGLEALNLIGDQFGLTSAGGFWGAVGALNDNFGALGAAIVGIFLVGWIASMLAYRIGALGRVESVAS